ncbi:MAG: hypothetical protein OHK0011_00860 [Turneriella sp.]
MRVRLCSQFVKLLSVISPDTKPDHAANLLVAAEKAAELVQEASERFLEELNREYRRQVRGVSWRETI